MPATLVPASVPGAAALQNYVNNTIWGRQANVYFTVTRSDHNVYYDLDGNGLLADPEFVSATSDEINAISAAAQDSTVDFNMYYVQAVEYGVALAIAARGEAWSGDAHARSTVNITAHEVGHLLGRAGESLNGLNVMYGGDVGVGNPTRVIKHDWDLVNP